MEWCEIGNPSHGSSVSSEIGASFLAGGSGAGDGAQRSEVAQPIFPLGAAPRAKDRESSDGTETRSSLVLDVATRMEL